MKIKDLQEISKCKQSKDIKWLNHSEMSIPIEEQECHFNMSRQDKLIYVDCSYQTYMLKLIRSPLFTLTQITYCDLDGNKGFILAIAGVLELNAITIRKCTKVGTDLATMRSYKQKKA